MAVVRRALTGKSRAAAVLLIGMLIVNSDVKVLVICKENNAARSFVQLLLSTSPPASVLARLGRLVSDEEYSANRTELDVPPSDRNDSLKTKRALVATGGLLANELKSRWSGIRNWSEQLTVAFMEEAQLMVVLTKLWSLHACYTKHSWFLVETSVKPRVASIDMQLVQIPLDKSCCSALTDLDLPLSSYNLRH